MLILSLVVLILDSGAVRQTCSPFFFSLDWLFTKLRTKYLYVSNVSMVIGHLSERFHAFRFETVIESESVR